MSVEDLEKLLPAVMDGQLSNEEHAQLAEILQDAECRKIYDAYIETHSLLHFKYDRPQLKIKKPISFRWLYAVAAVALIILLPFFMIPKSIANVIEQHDTKIKETEFSPGSILNLKEGLVKVQMKGVYFIVEAPARVTFLKKNRIRLHKGNLWAHVTDSESGFTVLTDHSEIIDKGTEFCVSAGAQQTQVHVKKGSVIAKGNSGSETLLKKDEAMSFKTETERKIKARPDLFVRALPGKSVENPNFIHWSFDQAVDNSYPSISSGIEDYPAQIHSVPDSVEGKFGNALYFDGVQDFLTTSYPGIGGSHPRTVAFWVKVPKDAEINNAVSMLGWGSYDPSGGRTFQISWNWLNEDGKIGAIRTGLFKGQVVGKKDLRDGQWHHVAVVCYGGDNADLSTHVLLYLNGELHKTSRKSVLGINTDISSKTAIKMLMGRAADNYFKNDSPKTFRGTLDEVYVFEAALSGDQIRKLLKYNRAY